MAKKLRCYLGNHQWRVKGRGDALTYFCADCGKSQNKPPKRTGGASAPIPPGGGGSVGG
jgi:hypothetical protein